MLKRSKLTLLVTAALAFGVHAQSSKPQDSAGKVPPLATPTHGFHGKVGDDFFTEYASSETPQQSSTGRHIDYEICNYGQHALVLHWEGVFGIDQREPMVRLQCPFIELPSPNGAAPYAAKIVYNAGNVRAADTLVPLPGPFEGRLRSGAEFRNKELVPAPSGRATAMSVTVQVSSQEPDGKHGVFLEWNGNVGKLAFQIATSQSEATTRFVEEAVANARGGALRALPIAQISDRGNLPEDARRGIYVYVQERGGKMEFRLPAAAKPEEIQYLYVVQFDEKGVPRYFWKYANYKLRGAG